MLAVSYVRALATFRGFFRAAGLRQPSLTSLMPSLLFDGVFWRLLSTTL
jgi:hypothetical protein